MTAPIKVLAEGWWHPSKYAQTIGRLYREQGICKTPDTPAVVLSRADYESMVRQLRESNDYHKMNRPLVGPGSVDE